MSHSLALTELPPTSQPLNAGVYFGCFIFVKGQNEEKLGDRKLSHKLAKELASIFGVGHLISFVSELSTPCRIHLR